jgi:hypothetical protein
MKIIFISSKHGITFTHSRGRNKELTFFGRRLGPIIVTTRKAEGRDSI